MKTIALVLLIFALGGCLGEEAVPVPTDTPFPTSQAPIYERPKVETRPPATTAAPETTVPPTTMPPATLPPTTQPPTVTPAPRVFVKDPVLQRTILNTIIGTDLVYDTLANRTVFSLEEKDIASMDRDVYQGESVWRVQVSKAGHWWNVYVSRDGTRILNTVRIVSFR